MDEGKGKQLGKKIVKWVLFSHVGIILITVAVVTALLAMIMGLLSGNMTVGAETVRPHDGFALMRK